MGNLREQVTFHQYDAPDMAWHKEGGEVSPYRRFIARHMLPFIGDVRGLSVLDVGCGTGWLLHLLGQEGATRLVGLEPSSYARLAAQYYPEAEIVQTSIESYATTATYDLITLVMSTEVMDDLHAAFVRCRQLVANSGRMVLCKGDYDYFCADKYDYVLTREEYIPGQETVVKTERPSGYGTTIDIYRSTGRVVDVAKAAGWELLGRAQPFAPDDAVIKAVPRYAEVGAHPIMELVAFKPSIQTT